MERGRPRPHPAKMRPRTGAVHHDRRGCSRSITRRRMGPATPRWAPSSALSASRRRYNLAFSPRINADQTARGMAGLRLSSLRPDLRASASHFFCRIVGSDRRPFWESIRDLGHEPRKIPARRAVYSARKNGLTPIPAEPGHLELEISLAASPLVVNPRHVFTQCTADYGCWTQQITSR
jgi:hypothetical protein